jgi:glycosyltransferase involved in cell wall biosynthesis
VDTETFRPLPAPRRQEYLMVSALVPYKRIDRALRAMQRCGRRLRIVGEGPERSRLERLAGDTATFLGRLPEADLVEEYGRCRALLMPGVEDAGIAPLEAMACGRPVIALNAGGVPEVVVPPGAGEAPTGLLFEQPTAAGLARAVERFESLESGFDPAAIRRHARRYDQTVFRRRLREAIAETAPAEARAEGMS